MGLLVDAGKVNARFVNALETTVDMNIYLMSLQARRRFLYQRWKAQQAQQEAKEEAEAPADATTASTKGVEASLPVRLLGCGPPPYNLLEVGLNS